jgi:hypothetical protein
VTPDDPLIEPIERRRGIDGGPCVRQTLRMRRRWPARSLAGALTRVADDVTYRRARSGALELPS